MLNNPYYTPQVFNPNITPQQRIAQMEQQYMNYTQPNNVPQQWYKMYPVANIEEANATPVDVLNDIPTFFLNKAKNEIYLKQYNSQTGLANFQTFQLIQGGTNETKQESKVTLYEKELKALNTKVDSLCALLQPQEQKEEVKGGKNAK